MAWFLALPEKHREEIRWAARSRSRSKERRAWKREHGDTSAAPDGETRLRRDSTTDYAADNSSEHSSTATPLTQSPRHRLLTLQHVRVSLIETYRAASRLEQNNEHEHFHEHVSCSVRCSRVSRLEQNNEHEHVHEHVSCSVRCGRVSRL
uniref:Uncharacterized protein n=1 Tax=Timema douglasi TaxID=61478 RepID=A0A7R8VMZ4_TIMDO|nr:unnamed protein product [Timema douglasi]